MTISTLSIAIAQESTFNVSGYVKEKSSGELLVGVNIYVPGTQIGTTTNRYGFYSLRLPSDSVLLAFRYVGYKTVIKSFRLTQDTILDIEIYTNKELEEVEITDSRINKESNQVQMSRMEIPVKQVDKIPALLGEKDVMKVLQLMPGVQSGSESSSGLYVRGGGPDQNLIILDDAPVYNVNHLFGFFSVFNGDALKSIELTKGGFPARYGGRLSSVLDMTMKDGNKQKFTGTAGIGLISSSATLEGPIKKDTASFIISGRRTYADLLIRPFIPEDETAGYYFYDLNAKVNYAFSRRNKLYVSGYFGKDRFYAGFDDSEAGLDWGNSTVTLRWNHLFNNKIFSNTSLIFSRYNMEIFEESTYDTENFELSYSSGIKDYGIKYDIQYHPSSAHTIRSGLISTYHLFKPSALVVKDDNVDQYISEINEIPSLESAFYIEDEFKLQENMKINAGMRFAHFLHSDKSYYNWEPRFSMSYQLKKQAALKASYAKMTQPIHLLSNTGIGLPTDLWIPSTTKITPQESWQIAAGYVKDFNHPQFTVSLEGYYKKSDNVKGYKEGASFLLIDNPYLAESYTWESNITEGQSWSYGAELLVQKKSGPLSGWIGYTLSWTQLQFDDINFGERYYARYDRRHDISIVAMYEVSKHFEVSATWVYGTGNAISVPLSEYPSIIHAPHSDHSVDYQNYHMFELNEYGKKNNTRMAPYHRLDIGVQFHKKINIGERSWRISVYNAYNRKNPFFYYVGYENNKNVLKQISLFPIIPSVSYHLKF